MLELITDWLIERRLKKQQLDPTVFKDPKRQAFTRVLNTLRTNKIVVVTEDDGIYVRMAGDESKGECFSLDFARVVNFEKLEEK